MKKEVLSIALTLACWLGVHAQVVDTQTHRHYLSGTGCDDMVEWDFFCTDGRNSGKWTKIGVPSCWELQGFGTYQYGMRFYGKANPEGIADEKGLYKYEFTLPKEWAGRQIFLVFEAAFTDLKATINIRVDIRDTPSTFLTVSLREQRRIDWRWKWQKKVPIRK